MKINWTIDREDVHSEGHVSRIVIDLEPGDDPDQHIAGLLIRGRLEAFLRTYPKPVDLGSPANAADALELLSGLSFVTGMCQARLEAMQLAARDQWQLGWGSIASAVESSRTTVKRQILKARGELAAKGGWYDPAGFHLGSVHESASAFDGALQRDEDDGGDQDDDD